MFLLFRIVHLFLQKNFGNCHWITYNIEMGIEGSWIKKGIFQECLGYEISMHLFRASDQFRVFIILSNYQKVK